MKKRIIKKEVRIKIKIADYELEVSGPQLWAEKMIDDFVRRVKRQTKGDRR